MNDGEAHKRTQERYALAMQASEEGYWDWVVATDEFYASPRMLDLYGLAPDAVFQGRADFLRRYPFHAEDLERWNQAVAAYLAGETPRVDIEVRMQRHGEPRWIRLTALCQREASGAPVRWTGLVGDITARKQAEQALRLSEERYALAMQASGEGHWDWNIATDEYYASPRNNELAGFPPDTKWNGRADILAKIAFHPDDWPRYRAAVADHFAGKTPRMNIDMRIVHPGGIRWLRMVGMCLRDAGGKPVRWAGSAMDITEQKKAEEALRVSEERLRQAQRLEALGTLAGGIAHDFNNILGAVLGYGEMALQRAAPGSRLRHELECILTAGERGRSLVERILAFSRGGIAEQVAVDVEKVVREALAHISAILPPNVRLVCELTAGRAGLRGDPTQVHQILTNLATNAMHAMAAGGVLRVTLRTERAEAARTATIGTLPSGNYIVLSVADSGTGIPAEILDRVFDPFFTTKEVGVGTGLGLSLVHGTVSNLGGAIDVATAAGAGTTFTVYFPRGADVSELDVPDRSALPAGKQQRVLVVDDEEALVTLVCRTLETLGYVPAGFTSSSAALQAFRADPLAFDALITDERMPGLSGAALIREVRAIRSALPTLLVSGYIGGKVTLDALEAGADEVLKKPLLARELARSLARVFSATSGVTASP
ncbi:MAG TPA: ATP-binding protein [Burkholderiales bacterium]|nr:ATP-binding protein [Burkholderiales bacterium]